MTSFHRGLRSGLATELAAESDGDDRHERGQRDCEGIGRWIADVPNTARTTQAMIRITPSAPMIEGIGAESPRSRADAAGEVGRRVRDERRRERGQHPPIAVEVVPS